MNNCNSTVPKVLYGLGMILALTEAIAQTKVGEQTIFQKIIGGGTVGFASLRKTFGMNLHACELLRCTTRNRVQREIEL